MAYTPTVWATGDVITAEKLNKAEEGIAANSKLVYIAAAEINPGEGPAITEGDFADACAVVEAGGIVLLIGTLVGIGVRAYFSCAYYDEPKEIDLFTVSSSGSSLSVSGVKWTAAGLGQWPLS